MIDRPDLDVSALRDELRMLENMNRRLGGHQLMLQYVQRLWDASSTAALKILDLGTGSADLPRAIAAWAKERRRSVTITAVDGNAQVVHLAKETCHGWPEIQLEEHNLAALPYPPGSFDLVLCSLALHHLSAANAVTLLRRIREIARLGYIVSDLRRNRLAIWAVELMANAVIKNSIFRHDACMSSRAAFTVPELHDMAVQAGLENFAIRRHHAVFRMVLTGKK